MRPSHVQRDPGPLPRPASVVGARRRGLVATEASVVRSGPPDRRRIAVRAPPHARHAAATRASAALSGPVHREEIADADARPRGNPATHVSRVLDARHRSDPTRVHVRPSARHAGMTPASPAPAGPTPGRKAAGRHVRRNGAEGIRVSVVNVADRHRSRVEAGVEMPGEASPAREDSPARDVRPGPVLLGTARRGRVEEANSSNLI
jgi:hypothetical protein